uniref:Uncharacterized protein n=1 Tax=Meloidogyne enterolobii TaxID=390850 RepID=A0A6V7WCV4_MELEN|nr:unnamed protein product [Meloidogyne enterolobii]
MKVFFKNYYSPNQLRDFYENEQMILFTSWMKERRSVSPTNWRSEGNIVSKQIQIVSQQQQVFASTTLKSQLQVSFDPSIPPPPIIKQQISPILKISEENENNLNKKEELTTNLVVNNEKNQKSKNKNKRKKRKAPFSILISDEEQDEQEEEEGIEISKKTKEISEEKCEDDDSEDASKDD